MTPRTISTAPGAPAPLSAGRRSRVQVVADAVQFLGATAKGAKADQADEPQSQPADKPALGSYRRKAS